MKVISVSNFKGGVGKTTTCLNLAYELMRLGKRILLIDMDPQGTLSTWVPSSEGPVVKELADWHRKSIANVLVPNELRVEKASIEDVTYRTKWESIDIVPATIELVHAKDGILNNNHALLFAIEDMKEEYDFIIIDCRPDIDIKVTCALVAATHVIIPIKFDGATYDGLTVTVEAVKDMHRELRLPAKQYKVLRTFQKPTTGVSKASNELLEQKVSPELIFETYIHDTIKIAESTLAGTSLRERTQPSESGYKAVQEYEMLAKEVLAWVETEDE